MDSTIFAAISLLLTIHFTGCLAQIDLNECLKNKTCLFYPTHCEDKGNCEKVVSYAPQPDGWTVIELFYNGTHPSTNYAAIGFSNDDQMGDDAVTHCGFDEANQAGVFLSRNVGKHNQPLNITEEDAAEFVELLQANHMPNSIYCKFRQKLVPDIWAQEQYVPDLNRTYHLLLAFGETGNFKELGIHSLEQGSRDFPSVISTPVDVSVLASTTASQPTAQKISPKRILVLIHGVLMILAWMWLAASAIVASRYLRDLWPHTTPFGLKIWFHMHRTMNALAVLLSIVSVLLVFIGKDWRWSGPAVGRSTERNLSVGAFHSIIGAIAVALMLTQPAGALFRCDNGSKFRPIFNWTHRIIGLLAYILAMITILLVVIFFHVWIARWAAICVFAIYVVLVVLMIILVQKANTLAGQQTSSVTYETGGRHYRGEQINVITTGKYDNKAKKITATIVLTFIALAAILVVILMLLILVTL